MVHLVFIILAWGNQTTNSRVGRRSEHVLNNVIVCFQKTYTSYVSSGMSNNNCYNYIPGETPNLDKEDFGNN